MSAWLALTKKEFRLGLPAFLIALILFIGIIAGGYILGLRVGYERELFMTSLGVVVMMHLFFLIFYLYYSLNAERKRLHLWLHTPMSIGGLLLSKIVTGIVFMAITFITTLTVATIFFNRHFDIFNEQTIYHILGLSSFTIFATGISMAILFVFFWSIFLTFSQRINDFLSFVLTFILFLLFGWAYDYVTHMAFMETLTNWGSIQVKDIFVGLEFSMIEESHQAGTVREASIFYIGDILRELIVTVIMFFAACWIIDKKVEV